MFDWVIRRTNRSMNIKSKEVCTIKGKLTLGTADGKHNPSRINVVVSGRYRYG
jgi:hypothetical protein